MPKRSRLAHLGQFIFPGTLKGFNIVLLDPCTVYYINNIYYISLHNIVTLYSQVARPEEEDTFRISATLLTEQIQWRLHNLQMASKVKNKYIYALASYFSLSHTCLHTHTEAKFIRFPTHKIKLTNLKLTDIQRPLLLATLRSPHHSHTLPPTNAYIQAYEHSIYNKHLKHASAF